MSGDKLTVTQEDVARAKEVAALTYGTAPLRDVAELFAKHRTNTTTELVEALRDLLAGLDRAYPREPYEEEPEMFARAREALALHDRALGK